MDPEPRQVKSVKQLSDTLKQAKLEIDLFLNCQDIPRLQPEEDLQKLSPTIETLLKDVPSEQRLKEMLDHPLSHKSDYRKRILSNYQGNYQTIRKAAENFDNLKPQSEKIYYLAAQLQLLKIGQEQGPANLRSAEVSQNDNAKVQRFQKNTIATQYFRELKADQLKGVNHPSSSDSLQPGEPLLHLSLYDSLSGDKTFEYVCFGEQTLFDLVSKFYCLISRLEGKEKSHHLQSYFLIEDHFYFTGNTTKKKIQQIIKLSEQVTSQCRPLAVVDMSKVKVKNLRVVFGRPYLFRHLEGCDHTIVFKDLRILSQRQATDPIKKDKYPLVVFEGRMRRRKCEGCKTSFADQVSLSDPLKGGKNLYLCGGCRQNLDSGGQFSEGVFVKYLHD